MRESATHQSSRARQRAAIPWRTYERLGIASSLVLLATTLTANAAEYPVRPVRIVVPWVAGGGTDIVARILVPKLTAALGQQVVIDNRPGANGIVGSEVAAKATPDGYTLVLEAVEHVVNASTYAKLPYDTIRDFAPIGLIAAAGFGPMTSTPEELDAFGKAELARWAKVAKAAGVRID